MRSPKKPKVSAMPEVQLHSLMLCDLLRKEEGGKLMLIGCYRQGVLLGKKPAIFSGRVVGGFAISPNFSGEIEFRINSPTMVGRGKFTPPADAAEDPQPGYGAFEANIRALITEPGEIEFTWRVDGGEWSSPVTWPIRFSSTAKELSAEDAEKLEANYWGNSPTKAPKVKKLAAPKKAQPKLSS